MAQSSGSSDNPEYVSGRRKKRWTDQMLASGTSTAPVGHPIELATRPITALLGGLFERQEVERERAVNAAAIAATLSGVQNFLGEGDSQTPISTTTTPVASAADTDPGAATPTGVPPQTPSFAALEGSSPNARIANIITGAAERHGVDPNYMLATAGRESNFDPNARAKTSSAKGLFQFTNGTAQAYGLRNPFDPEASSEAAAKLARDNAARLMNAGHEPTPANLYAAHFLGGAGATRFLNGLRENPNAPAASYVQEGQARANRTIFFNRDGSPKTAAHDFSSKFGGQTGPAVASPAPAAQTDGRIQVASADPSFVPMPPPRPPELTPAGINSVTGQSMTDADLERSIQVARQNSQPHPSIAALPRPAPTEPTTPEGRAAALTGQPAAQAAAPVAVAQAQTPVAPQRGHHLLASSGFRQGRRLLAWGMALTRGKSCRRFSSWQPPRLPCVPFSRPFSTRS